MDDDSYLSKSLLPAIQSNRLPDLFAHMYLLGLYHDMYTNRAVRTIPNGTVERGREEEDIVILRTCQRRRRDT